MLQSLVTSIALFSQLNLSNPDFTLFQNEHILATREISLDSRYSDPWVNNVMKDNILLTLAYLRGDVTSGTNIDWDNIEKPFSFALKVSPGKTFAFQGDVLPEYEGKVIKTTNTHFNSAEGFKSDGYLYGDGVCHLASLLNWVARDAKLDVKNPTNHDFASIPEVPKEYGTSIYYGVGSEQSNALQNLYITNNRAKDVALKFDYYDGKLTFSISDLQ